METNQSKIMSAETLQLEYLRDKVRKGEPICFLGAIAVINYQEQIRADRKANSPLNKLRSWWKKVITSSKLDG